jgi:hypothetical protein
VSLAPEPSAFKFELTNENLQSPKSQVIDQITAEMDIARGRKFRCEILRLTISIWNKEELPEEWKESIIEPIYTKGDKTDCSNYRDIPICQLRTKCYSTSCCQSLHHVQRK